MMSWIRPMVVVASANFRRLTAGCVDTPLGGAPVLKVQVVVH